jgi:hypothetical protein
MERRRAYRVAWDHPVSCQKIEGDERQRVALDARSVDVSTDGIRLATTRPLRPADRLQLHLHCDDPLLDVHALGLVVRAAGTEAGLFRSGVRFARMAELGRSELAGFIAEQALRSGVPVLH